MAKKITYFFGADISELERGMKRIEYKMGKASATLQKFGSSLTRNVTMPLVGLGALALRESISFESAFARVKKSVGGTVTNNFHIHAVDAQSFANLVRTNKGLFESITVENILRNGAVRSAIRGAV